MRLRAIVIGLLAVLALFPNSAWAGEKPIVVATFSILADLAQRVGGDHIQVLTLVGPNGDAHAFEPGPRQSAELSEAAVLIANGLGFEPWLARLEASSGFAGKAIVCSDGVATLGWDTQPETPDPHAFQDVANAEIYATNIAKALSAADPVHAADFNANAGMLIASMKDLDRELKAEFAAIPPERRRVLTSHNAFQYFGRAYGIEFVAVQGISTEAEPTSEDLANIVRQARAGRISAVFFENMADPRLAETVAREAGARLGGELYADALSEPDGPAPDYLSLMRFNARQLLAAMQ